MAAFVRAPKQWCLSKSETVGSFENWKQNLQYTLSLDVNFAPLLVSGVTWDKKSKQAPLRGFIDDLEDVPQARRQTGEQKANLLELMLGQIANFCPVVSRNTIVKNSTSLDSIWQAIRLHFGFQSTGAQFLDLADIGLLPDERPEDLYQRLVAFVDDNLLTAECGIRHMDEPPMDEEVTPSVQNFIVLMWLRLIHPALPRLVKQRYGTELRSRTLASIKPEISQALQSLLDEINTNQGAQVLLAGTRPAQGRQGGNSRSRPTANRRSSQKTCALCKQAGRRDHSHFLSECLFLPESDRKYMARARQIITVLEGEEESEPEEENVSEPLPVECHSARRVNIGSSPYVDVFCGHQHVRVTIDSGATGNMIRESTAVKLGAKIRGSSQAARQADGSSPLTVLGETRLTFARESRLLEFEGLVVRELDVAVLAGIPFMESNDIGVRPAKRSIIFGDGSTATYGSLPAPPRHGVPMNVRRATILRAPGNLSTIWPGDFVEVVVPRECSDECETFAVEPRSDLTPKARSSWPKSVWPSPDILTSVSGAIRIPNMTTEPISLRRHQHFCQIRPVFIPTDTSSPSPNVPKQTITSHATLVTVDPDNLLDGATKCQFEALNREFKHVFDPNFPGYNGASGPFKAMVNMGPVLPPQRKGRLPQYARGQLEELQSKFDELESLGVFVRPEDVDVSIEYLNPSFLVKKSNGGTRLVTAFSDVGRYSKPQPSLLPDVDSTLRVIAKWKYIISTDLTSAFYQIPLDARSMKFCGVATPFRGVRAYARSAMGMPGSETALEELMCRVLGDLLAEGRVTKIADDLYCGGDSPSDLLQNWRGVLDALSKNDLRLSARKTTVCPLSTTILGWIWSNGTLSASPHRIATLTTCPAPNNVKGLRSFIGAYKVLARVLPGCASILSPLDAAVAGKDSNSRLIWTDSLHEAFKVAQHSLNTHRSIQLPAPGDQLWIVTDGAVKSPGIGATLYVSRGGKPKLAGFFSAKMRARQNMWIPCEIEALSIAAATRHFAPYIIQSVHKACILTDSKPCVQAFEKLCRGEFSTSPRVSTFLSTVSRYQASVRHLAGSANAPSDFASRNAPDCSQPGCQVCKFVAMSEDSTVLRVEMKEILCGTSPLPFTNRPAWVTIQAECPDLRRTHAHLRQGTRPSKKLRDVKRYLNVAVIAGDGLLVVRHHEPLHPSRDLIVVPRAFLHGLLTALHIQLDHPSRHQLKVVFRRYLYALDSDAAVDGVTTGCHQCTSLMKVPKTVTPQSTQPPPDAVGTSFAADVARRNRQFILVIRECVTSLTLTCLIENERQETLKSHLIRLLAEYHPLDGPSAVIRVDAAPGFQALSNDPLLREHRLCVEVGRIKNPNKNPVAERAIQELVDELLKLNPTGGMVSSVDLAIATANLNARLRSRGLSAREMWYQRDQFTNAQIPVTDQFLISSQNSKRIQNHKASERSKTPNRVLSDPPDVEVGDIVYVVGDRSKLQGRPRYMVTRIDDAWANIVKFSGRQLRNTTYRVRRDECIRVPSSIPHDPCRGRASDDETEGAGPPHDALEQSEETPSSCVPGTPPASYADPQPPAPHPPAVPTIPAEIETPSTSTNGTQGNPLIPACASSVLPPSVCADPLPPAEAPAPPIRPRRTASRPKYLDDYVTEF